MNMVKIASAGRTVQFEAHHYTGDDGHPAVAVFSPLYVDLADGRSFFLPQGKRVVDEEEGYAGYIERYSAEERLAEILAAGEVDLDEWVELEEPAETLEERLAPFGTEWQIEQEERGFGR